MDDEQFERILRLAAEVYHLPPEPPRREMWLRIQAARAAAAGRRQVRPLRPIRVGPQIPPLAWVAGIAALLAIGIGLGRLLTQGKGLSEAAPAIAASNESPSTAAYRHAMAEHLNHTETFLTLFKSSMNRADNDTLAAVTARQLLATNRLLRDSPAAIDPATRLLLDDVELVLTRIVLLSASGRPEDREMITRGMDQAGVLMRLHMQAPAGTAAFPGQGAL